MKTNYEATAESDKDELDALKTMAEGRQDYCECEGVCWEDSAEPI